MSSHGPTLFCVDICKVREYSYYKSGQYVQLTASLDADDIELNYICLQCSTDHEVDNNMVGGERANTFERNGVGE